MESKEQLEQEVVGEDGNEKKLKDPLELEVGGKDDNKEDILELYSKGPEYAVYRTETGIKTKFALDETKCKEQRACLSQISPLLTEIYRLQAGKLMDKRSINKEIGRGICQCIEGNLEGSIKILESIRKRLKNLRDLEGRLYYQLSSFGVVIIATIVLVITLLWIAQSSPEETKGTIGNYFLLLLQVMVCGSLGGFLSVSIKVRQLEFDIDATWPMHVITGASRIIIAMIGSLFVYFAIQSNLILGALVAEGQVNKLFMYAISIAAGFSESFVPNVIPKILEDKSVSASQIETSKQEDIPQQKNTSQQIECSIDEDNGSL
jgi:hypothetical protein